MRSALSLITASRSPCMESMTTSTASSASFFAILLRPERNSRAVREVDGSSCRQASAAWKRRLIESVIGLSEYRDIVAIVLRLLGRRAQPADYLLIRPAPRARRCRSQAPVNRPTPRVVRPAGGRRLLDAAYATEAFVRGWFSTVR